MGGHTSSPDEEGMFYVADSIVTAGCFVVPSDENQTVPGLKRGVDGRLYTPSGIATSAMLVPFVALGHFIGDGAPVQYRPFVIRLSANLLDPIVTALTGVILFALGMRLGYSARVSTLLALVFGLATIAWPYSKYLWSEPVTAFWLLLSALLLVAGYEKQQWPLALAAGVCFASSVASKVATGTALAGFLAYYGISVWEGLRKGRSIRGAVSQTAAFVVGLVAVLVFVGLYNHARFGSMTETGYGQPPFDLVRYGGIAGLLFSSGKSVFVYSPVTLLCLPGVVVFARRQLKKAVLLLLVVASQVLLYGSFVDWHGDAAWGPRYLVPITAFLVLPVGSLLMWTDRRWVRPAYAALFTASAVGFLVQIGGVVVNYDSWTISTGGTHGELAEQRRHNPLTSPVVQHWQLLASRVVTWREHFRDGVELVSGFYPSEGQPGALYPRWTNGAGILVIRWNRSEPLDLTLAYRDHRPSALGPATVTLTVDGRTVPESVVRRSKTAGGSVNTLEISLPPDELSSGRGVVSILSNTWYPSKEKGSTDRRELGIMIIDLGVRQADLMLPTRESPVRPFPATESVPWSRELFAWFYDPRNAHLADSWIWYLYFSGLSRWLVALGMIPVVGVVASAWLLVRSWRRLDAAPEAVVLSAPILTSAYEGEGTS